MALVGNTYLTLRDALNQEENGNITSTIIDLFSQTSSILDDAAIKECNDGTSNKTTVRNGLPNVEFRQFYEGVNCSKGEYTQVKDETGMLEAYSEVDKALVDINIDKNQFRLNEAQGFIEAMNQTLEENIFYGSKKTNPAAFDGFANRYNKISADEKSIGNLVIDAGGTGDTNTSIWFVTWGDLHTHLIYPKGTKGGLKHQDLGEATKQLPGGAMYQVYRDHFTWNVGLSLRDFRSTCRIANIDVSKLETEDATDLINKMVIAYNRIEDYCKSGKTVIYANRKIRTYLQLQAMNKPNIHLTIDQIGGKPIVSFLGIPIRTCNKIICNEEAVA